MGYVNVELGGSFGNTKPHSNVKQQFSALELGHAAAISEAIEFLASLLPCAIDLDHRLQATADLDARRRIAMSEAEHDELDYYTWLGEQAAVPPVPDPDEYVYRVRSASSGRVAYVTGAPISADEYSPDFVVERSRVEWEAMPEPAGATQAVGVAEGVEDGSP
jgi:hypothetical protein